MVMVARDYLKKWLYKRIGVCFNSVGVPFSLAKRLERSSPLVLVDVGAHRGTFTSSVDRFCGVRQGLLVEAQPERARELSEAFPAPRFEVANVAACDRASQIQLEVNEFDPTTSILRMRREMPELSGLALGVKAKVPCKTARLDDLVSPKIYAQIDLLKLDVQGAEHLVLRGAESTLRRTSMVWTEVSFVPLYEGSVLFHEIHQQLRGNGFALAELEPGFRSAAGELLQGNALFLRL